jgi:hypothetical protein
MVNPCVSFDIPFPNCGMKLEGLLFSKKWLLPMLGGLFFCSLARASDCDDLLGDWHRTQGAVTCENSFRKDGTFDGRCANGSAVLWEFSGNWTVSGDVLQYEYKKSSLVRIPAGTKDADKLIAVTPGYYIVKGTDGVQRRYDRSLKP